MRSRLSSLLRGAPTLKVETVTYAAATLMERLVTVVTVPLLTRAVAPDLFGVWTQVLVSASLLSSIMTVGLATAEVNFLAGTTDHHLIHRWFLRLTTPVLINSAILVAVFSVFSTLTSRAIFGAAGYETFAVGLGLLVVSEAIFEMQTGMLRARQRIRAISAYAIAKSVIRLTAIVLVIYAAGMSLATALIAIVVLQMLLVIFVELREAPRSKHRIDSATPVKAISRRTVAGFAVVLFVYSSLVMVHVTGIRYFLAHTLDVGNVGIFAVAVGLTSSTIGLVYSVLGFTLYPRVASAWNRSQPDELRSLMQRGITVYVLISAPIAALLMAMPREIMSIFAGSGYTVSVATMVLLVVGLAAFGAYQLLFYLVLSCGEMNRNFSVLIAALIIQFGSAALLINSMGMTGAALAFFLGNVVILAGTRWQQQRMFDVPLPWGELAGAAGAGLAMGISAVTTRIVLHAWPLVPRAAAAALIGVTVFALVGMLLGLQRHLGLERRTVAAR